MDKETNYKDAQAYYYTIYVFDKMRNRIVLNQWKDMPFTIYERWFWYFKYREALHQVENPREVILRDYGMQKEHSKFCELKFKQNRLTAAKRKLSETKNKLEKYKASYNLLFPIEESEFYIEGMRRISNIENRIINLKNQIDALSK